jgi:hypothetical protein
MPGVKNSVPSKLGADAAQALPPIIGLVSRHAFRAAKCFEHWNFSGAWMLELGISFPNARPRI